MNTNLRELEDTIKYRFSDEELLRQALYHPSYSGEMRWGRERSNQRLEFLGDAVLELVVSDYLYRAHPDVEEGELTRMRSSLVFEAALTVCARDISLGDDAALPSVFLFAENSVAICSYAYTGGSSGSFS